jgi:sec-independent protein translocase protein TatA
MRCRPTIAAGDWRFCAKRLDWVPGRLDDPPRSTRVRSFAMLGLFDQLGAPEILIILAVFLLLFGAKKLPELARSLGKSSTEFKKGLKEGASKDELPEETEASPAPAEKKPAESSATDE